MLPQDLVAGLTSRRGLRTCLLLAVAACGRCSSATQPHAHGGVITPYVNGPMKIELSGADLRALEAGKMVMRMNAEKTSGVAVQDVDAPVDCVLAQIINGEDYVGKVPGLSSVKNYAEKKRGDGAVLTKATYLLKLVMGYQLEYFINQIYVPKNRCLTWTLDYSRKSDLHDSAGYWRVDPLPGQPGRSRVFYSSSSLVLGMPQFVMDLLTSQALKASTAWVKKYAEKEYAPKRAAAAAAATPTSAGGGEKRFSWRSALARKCRAKVGDDGSTSRAAVAEAEAESKADWKNRIFNFTFLASMLLVHLRPSQNFFVMAS